MNGVKGIAQSKTFWGVVMVLAIPILRQIGFDLDDATGMEIAGDLVQLAGAAFAIYGRIVAKVGIDTRSVKTTIVGGGP